MDDAIPRSLRIAAAISWRVLVVGAAIAALAIVLAALRIVLLPLFVALLLATLLVPPARWLRSRGVPKLAATIAVFAGAAVVAAALLAVLAAFIISDLGEFEEIGDRVNDGVDRAADWLSDSGLDVSDEDIDEAIDDLRDELRDNADRIAAGAFTGALIAVEIGTGAVLAAFLLFFFVNDGPRMWSWVVRLFPAIYQDDVHEIGHRSWVALGRYFRGTAIVAFVDATLIGIALLILDVPFALPLALLIFLGSFVPIVGALVTGFVAVMVALASHGVFDALVVLAVIVTVQQLEGTFLQPFLVGRSVQLHPVAIIVAVTAGGSVWGIPGAFVAVPLVAVVYSVVCYVAGGRGEDEAAGLTEAEASAGAD